MGIVIRPTAYISWIPYGKIILQPTDAYISWMPQGRISIRPQIAAAWVPMGRIHFKMQILATIVPPAKGQSKATADIKRQVAQSNQVIADSKIQTVKTEQTNRICYCSMDECRFTQTGGNARKGFSRYDKVSKLPVRQSWCRYIAHSVHEFLYTAQ